MLLGHLRRRTVRGRWAPILRWLPAAFLGPVVLAMVGLMVVVWTFATHELWAAALGLHVTPVEEYSMEWVTRYTYKALILLWIGGVGFLLGYGLPWYRGYRAGKKTLRTEPTAQTASAQSPPPLPRARYVLWGLVTVLFANLIALWVMREHTAVGLRTAYLWPPAMDMPSLGYTMEFHIGGFFPVLWGLAVPLLGSLIWLAARWVRPWEVVPVTRGLAEPVAEEPLEGPDIPLSRRAHVRLGRPVPTSPRLPFPWRLTVWLGGAGLLVWLTAYLTVWPKAFEPIHAPTAVSEWWTEYSYDDLPAGPVGLSLPIVGALGAEPREEYDPTQVLRCSHWGNLPQTCPLRDDHVYWLGIGFGGSSVEIGLRDNHIPPPDPQLAPYLENVVGLTLDMPACDGLTAEGMRRLTTWFPRVQHLGLSSQLPPSYVKVLREAYPSLESLDITWGNSWTPGIITELPRFTSIRHLTLGWRLPPQGLWDSLTQAPVTELTLQTNEPPPEAAWRALRRPTTLRSLDISSRGYEVEAVFPYLAGLQVEHLRFDYRHTSEDLTLMARCLLEVPTLRSFDLWVSEYATPPDLRPLHRHPALREIRFRYPETVVDPLYGLEGHPRIERVIVRWDDDLDNDALSTALASLPALREVVLESRDDDCSPEVLAPLLATRPEVRIVVEEPR